MPISVSLGVRRIRTEERTPNHLRLVGRERTRISQSPSTPENQTSGACFNCSSPNWRREQRNHKRS